MANSDEVDWEKVRKQVVVMARLPTPRGGKAVRYVPEEYQVGEILGKHIWKFSHRLAEPMTRQEFRQSKFRNLPVIGFYSMSPDGQPLTDFEKAQIFGAGEVDWRPTETIPEDYYGA